MIKILNIQNKTVFVKLSLKKDAPALSRDITSKGDLRTKIVARMGLAPPYSRLQDRNLGLGHVGYAVMVSLHISRVIRYYITFLVEGNHIVRLSSLRF